METIVKEYQEGKLILGTKQTLKLLRKNKIEKVYLSSTAPESLLDLLKGIEVKKLKLNAVELGKYLGKNFPVTVCSVRK